MNQAAATFLGAFIGALLPVLVISAYMKMHDWQKARRFMKDRGPA